MTAMNCPRCGKIFAKVRDPICSACVKEEEEIFEKVRLYVRDNPHKTIKEVCDECDVSTKRVLAYLKDGKLEASTGLQDESTCSKCGRPIRTGRMCEICIGEVNTQVGDMKEKSKIKNRGRVFTADMNESQ